STDFPITPGAFLHTPPAVGTNQPFLTRLNLDGSGLVYSTYLEPQANANTALAVDPTDSAAVALLLDDSTIQILRIIPSGSALVFSKILSGIDFSGLAVDSSGKTYVAFLTAEAAYPVKNTLLPCGNAGTSVLSVLDSQGDTLQTT